MLFVTLNPTKQDTIDTYINNLVNNNIYAEYRYDLFQKFGVSFSKEIISKYASNLLLSCSATSKANLYNNFDSLIDSKLFAVQVDAEWNINQQDSLIKKSIDFGIYIIVAFHPSVDQISKLPSWIQSWKNIDIHYIKIVLPNMPLEDSLVLINQLSKLDNRVICFSITEEGCFTRYINLNHRLIYCADQQEDKVLPGQPTLQEAKYIKEDIERGFNKKLLWGGLIGKELSNSPGYIIHNIWNEYYQTQKRYFNIPLRKLNTNVFFKAMGDLKGINLSVTSPFKGAVSQLTPDIKSLPGHNINTLSFFNGQWRGINTDIKGIMHVLSLYNICVDDSICILGSGPVAESTIMALINLNIKKISLVTRSPDKAKTKLDHLFLNIDIQSYKKPIDANVLISTLPHAIQPSLNFMQNNLKLVFDVNLNPNIWSSNLAIKCNCKFEDGRNMWLIQAIEQFKYFNPSLIIDDKQLKKLAAPILFPDIIEV